MYTIIITCASVSVRIIVEVPCPLRAANRHEGQNDCGSAHAQCGAGEEANSRPFAWENSAGLFVGMPDMKTLHNRTKVPRTTSRTNLLMIGARARPKARPLEACIRHRKRSQQGDSRRRCISLTPFDQHDEFCNIAAAR